MKNQIKLMGTTAFVAGLLMGTGSVQAQTTVHHWKMDAWSGDSAFYVGGAIQPWGHGLFDSANGVGQGVNAGTSGEPNVANDPMYVWGPMESLAGGLIGPAAPAAMLNGITSSGSFNYNAAIGLGGQSFYAADQFGNEYNGPSITAELFFKTTGTPGGVQTLLWAKEGHAATHIQIGSGGAGAGGLEFWGWNGAGFDALTLTTAQRPSGYEDGLWHYVAARYDAGANLMSLLTVSEDGDVNYTSQVLANDLVINGGNNNIIVGRQEGEGNRFAGLIDEVRLSNGVVADGNLLAVVPEPSSLALVGLGALAMVARRNRK